MGVSFFLANARTDRPTRHRRHLPPLPRAELRLRRERHRVDPVRPRGARLAVAQLRRAQGAPRVRPAARASTSGARSTAASGSSATSALAAIDQIGADNILYETDFPHPTSMSPGPASDRPAARRVPPRRRSPASTSIRCARSSTTTPHASTTSTEAARLKPSTCLLQAAHGFIRSRQNRAPVGDNHRAAVDRAQLFEPQFHRHPGVELGTAWHRRGHWGPVRQWRGRSAGSSQPYRLNIAGFPVTSR